MKNAAFYTSEAYYLKQGRFELEHQNVIEVFDTYATTLTTEDKQTITIYWNKDTTFSCYVVNKTTTAQMAENNYTLRRVKEVISILKNLTLKCDCVDGETMQYILKEVGMNDQMLRQLMMSEPLDDVEYVWEERKNL